MPKTNTLNLVNLVILNCIGSGVLLIPKKISILGINAIFSWILTCLGSISIGIIFARLTKDVAQNSTIHDIVAFSFSERWRKMIRPIIFWFYYIFAIAGNAVFAIEIIKLIDLFTTLNALFEVAIYVFLFGIIHWMNRFGIGVSRLFTSLLVLLKFMVMLILPILCSIKVWPNFYWNWTSTPFSTKSVLQGAFSTLWAYLGIETISIGQKASYQKLFKSVIIGSTICLFTYLLNTILLLTMVPGLSNSESPYADLFSILFGQYSKQITIIISGTVFFGMLHGWTLAASSTFEGGAGIVPGYFSKLNKYGSPEFALTISNLTAFLLCLIMRFIIKNDYISDYLIDTSTSVCLIVYLFGIIGFYRGKLGNKKSTRFLNILISICALVYCIMAFYGSPKIANISSLFIFLLLGLFYARF